MRYISKCLLLFFLVGLEWVTVRLNCRNDEGPTVLVIKDREGYIYGGYASQPWEKHGDFYGDMKSFLFQLYPKASIFRPTGVNHNVQWVSTELLHQFTEYFNNSSSLNNLLTLDPIP